MISDVTAGLKSVLTDEKAGHGYAQVTLGADKQQDALFARLEAGYRLTENVGAFAFGQVDTHDAIAGAGLRWQF